MNTKKIMTVMVMMVAVLLMLAPALFAQQCGSNQVDFGNANLGQQLTSQQSVDVNAIRQQLLAEMSTQRAPIQNVAMRQASASSSAASALTQPNGYLTFQEGGYAHSEMLPVPPMANDEVAELRGQVATLMAELNSMRSQRPVFQTAAFQSAGGASASSSAATSAAPSINSLALTAPTPAAVSVQVGQSACSSGGCGGGSRFQLFRGGGGRRSVSRSRSSSVTVSR